MDHELKSVCPYTRDSLEFFLLLPLTKLCQYLELPTLLGYVVALVTPLTLLEPLVKFLKKVGHITLVNHAPEKLNHKHSSATTVLVILHSLVLGILLTTGLTFVCNQQLEQHFVPLGFYLILLATFHFSEFFVTSLTNPSTLAVSSFLIDQSYAYVIAITCSFIEYYLEAYLFPQFKKFNIISMLGLMIAISGELVRKLAMLTAGRNFSHCITQTKSPDHKLVTHGIYSYFRHPSYAGWFYWAVGSQVLLLNPICIVMFSLTSYKFFKDRIHYEEQLLVDFFGKDYENYREQVGIWMPI